MINGFEVNGGEINGSGDVTNWLSLTATLPTLAGEAYLFESDPNGVRNGILPALTGTIYGGAIVSGTLPRLTGSATLTAQNLLRLSATLPALAGSVSLTVENGMVVDGLLPILTGQILGGAIITGALPGIIGTITLTAEGQMSVAGNLPQLTGSITLTVANSLRVTGTLPAIQPMYGVVIGTLPKLTGTIILTAAQVRTLAVYAVNLANSAMSQYSNFPFQHIARFQGKTYGFDATGCYLLEGADDDGDDIAASITLPDFDYGTPRTKNVPYVIIGTKSENLTVEAWVDEAATPITATAMNTGRNKRAKFARGAVGVRWSHRISNVDGGAMDIDSLEIIPDIKRRRI